MEVCQTPFSTRKPPLSSYIKTSNTTRTSRSELAERARNVDRDLTYIPGVISFQPPTPRAPFEGSYFIYSSDAKKRTLKNDKVISDGKPTVVKNRDSKTFKFNKIVKNEIGFAASIVEGDVYLTDTIGVTTQIEIPNNQRIIDIAATATYFVAIAESRSVILIRPDLLDSAAAGVLAKTVHTTKIHIAVRTDSNELYMYNTLTHTGMIIEELEDTVSSVVSSYDSVTVTTKDGRLWSTPEYNRFGANISKTLFKEDIDEAVISSVKTDGAGAALTITGRVFVWGPTKFGGADTDGCLWGFDQSFVATDSTKTLKPMNEMTYVKSGGTVIRIFATQADMFVETRDGSYYKWKKNRQVVKLPDINSRNVNKIVHGTFDTSMITNSRQVYVFGPEKSPHYLTNVKNVIDVVSSGRAIAVHSAQHNGSVYVCGSRDHGGVNEAGIPGWIGMTGVTSLRGANGIFVASSETLNRSTGESASVYYSWGKVVDDIRFASFRWPSTISYIATNPETRTLAVILNNGYISVDGNIDEKERSVCGTGEKSTKRISHDSGVVIFGPRSIVAVGECRT